MRATAADPLPCYRFADFALDCGSRTLFRRRAVAETSDRTVQLLQFLLQRPGVLVGKYDPIESLWPEQDVTGWLLSRLVSDTRQLPGDSAEQQLVQTVRGHGFRLTHARREPISVSPNRPACRSNKPTITRSNP